MAAIFPPQSKGGVPPGPNVCNGFSPTHSVIGEGPSYVAPDCTTTLTDCQLNALVSELLAAVDELGFPYNSNRIDNLGQALRTLFDGIALDLDGKVNLAGDTMTGALILPGPPANDNEATTRAYVDGQDSSLDLSLRSYIDSETASIMTAAQNLVAALDATKVNRGGDQMTGPLLLIGGPTDPTEAVSKAYVDNIFLSEGHFVDAPMDGQLYGRQSAAWQPAVSINGPSNLSDAQQTQWRQSIYAAPFDVMAFTGMQLNSGMDVAQEHGTTPFSINNQPSVYVADAWMVTTTTNVVAQVSMDAPPGFFNSLKVSVSSPQPVLASMDTTAINTHLEGLRIARLALGTPHAMPFSIAWWVKAHRPGMYSGCTRNEPTPDHVYVFPFTINAADTWEFKTVTIPPALSGVFSSLNLAGLQVQFNLAAGPGRVTTPGQWLAASGIIAATGMVNGVMDTSDYMQITGVYILPGIQLPTADYSALLARSHEAEVLACKRYFYNGVPPLVGLTNPPGTAMERCGAPHPIRMRVSIPALVMTVPLPVFDGSIPATLTSIEANECTQDVLEFDATVSPLLGPNRAARVYQGAGGNLNVDARM